MKHQKLILDSFALIAYLEKETGGKRVKYYLKEAELKEHIILLSVIINWGEVYYSIYRAYYASKIKATPPIAYAGCFTAALSLQHQAKILTGNPKFEKLAKEVEIKWLPKKIIH